MKKTIFAVAPIVFLLACSSTASTSTTSTQSTTAETTHVDSYTSASTTRADVTTDSDTQDILVSVSSDLASLADSEVDGYEEPENAVITQMMTVNPDGTPGMSTIHAWKYDKDSNTVSVEMTDGQNAQNLAEVGKKGTLLVKADGKYYLLHLETVSVDELVYSDETYEAGEFNRDYSGASNQLSEFDMTFNVTMIESTFVYMFE